MGVKKQRKAKFSDTEVEVLQVVDVVATSYKVFAVSYK